MTKPGQTEHYSRILAAVDVEPDGPQQASLNRLLLDLATSLARMLPQPIGDGRE